MIYRVSLQTLRSIWSNCGQGWRDDRCGVAAVWPSRSVYVYTPEANIGKPLRSEFVIQLEEARKRRTTASYV